MSTPTTREELIAALDYMPVEDATFLADRMIGLEVNWVTHKGVLTVEQAYDAILLHQLLDQTTCKGWIDVQGKFWACRYMSHDCLLDVFGMQHDEPDYCGWVRISGGCENNCQMNPAQVKTLRRVAPWAYTWRKDHWAEEKAKPLPLTKEQYIEYFGNDNK